jgi:hypothetical protein
MPQQPRVRVVEASLPYSNRDTPHADKFCLSPNVAFNFQTQLDSLTNALNELVQRTRLSMAASQLWNGRNKIAFLIAFDDYAELAFGAFPHELPMPENGPRRNCSCPKSSEWEGGRRTNAACLNGKSAKIGSNFQPRTSRASLSPRSFKQYLSQASNFNGEDFTTFLLSELGALCVYYF